jgi:signal transduction histidine kinase
MAAGVAHEVDNHLSVVMGFSELIQIAAGNEMKVRDGAGKILLAGERTGYIIRHYSRYSRPHLPAREALVPAEAIPEILAFARYDLGRNNVFVSAPASAPPGALPCDPRDMALALLALLFNGSEAMAGTGGELVLSVEREQTGWKFLVTDQGPGIPPGQEERVFEEGYTTRSGPYHAGMGLPVARHLVSAEGGTLGLRNVPGGGCAATIRVPTAPPG